jgi:hypothetical protein
MMLSYFIDRRKVALEEAGFVEEGALFEYYGKFVDESAGSPELSFMDSPALPAKVVGLDERASAKPDWRWELGRSSEAAPPGGASPGPGGWWRWKVFRSSSNSVRHIASRLEPS